MFVIHNTGNFSQNVRLPQTPQASSLLINTGVLIYQRASQASARSAYCSYLQPFILRAVRVKERFLWNPDKCGNGAHAVRG